MKVTNEQKQMNNLHAVNATVYHRRQCLVHPYRLRLTEYRTYFRVTTCN